mgnify:CR=1|jgi:redox-sensitive bicupin YhaK (pirin superfamily)
MKRKDFLQKAGLTMLGGLAASKLSAKELTWSELCNATFDPLDKEIGFNHLPNKKSLVMNNMVIHRANTRGHQNHGWLKANHSFSFANYHNPERMHFGVLRVLNDDYIEAGRGFGTHPHDNMEIITIPLEGDLEHKDSMGNSGVIRHGDVQVMSAGKGIMHSEFNYNKDKPVKLFQIWLFPNKRNVEPRYDQVTFDSKGRDNQWQQILSPNSDDEGVWIHQDAWFHLGDFDGGKTVNYNLKRQGNGMYLMMISGKATINGQTINSRDAVGLWDTDKVAIETQEDSRFLMLEVPMQIA